MSNKKWVGIVLVLLMLLAGCGGQKTNDTAPSEKTETPAQEETGGREEGTDQQEAEEQVGEPMAFEVTQDNLSTYPATDESMFTTEPVEGGVSITSCADETSTVIVVPEQIGTSKVVGISDSAFAQLKMQGVVLPDTVEEIGLGAFAMCTELKYIDLGSGLKEIGMMAFTDCTSLARIEFPEGMTTFYSMVLYNCNSLSEVVVPGSVTEFSEGIVDASTCPNAVVVTPAGSGVEAQCIEYNIPYRNP